MAEQKKQDVNQLLKVRRDKLAPLPFLFLSVLFPALLGYLRIHPTKTAAFPDLDLSMYLFSYRII